MGILSIFKKKPAERITLDNIDEWLDRYVEQLEINSKISVFKRDVQSKVVRMKELLDDLDRAALHNGQIIPERAKSIFDGNKKSYIMKTRNFMEQLELPTNYSDISAFLEEASEKLSEHAEETHKNYLVIKEFIEDDIRPVSKKLQEIDHLITELRNELERTALEKVTGLKSLIKDYYEKKLEIERLKKDIEAIEKQKLDFYDRRGRVEIKVKHLKESEAYKDYEALLEKQGKLQQEHKSQEEKIREMFSKVASHLKKFAKDKQDSLAEHYESSPVQAMLEDTELRIIERLEDAARYAEELTIKPEKRERLIKEIKEITKDKLETAKEKLYEIHGELQGLEKRLAGHNAHLNLKEQEGWIHSIDQSIELENKKKSEIENKLERISLNLIKQKIKSHLKELNPEAEVNL